MADVKTTWPMYNPAQGYSTEYADWSIGKGRARELANYALSVFDKLIGGKQLTAEQKQLADNARAMIEKTVLSWEDESLGPKTEQGIPFSKTGAGAKKRYTDYIDDWVSQMVNSIITGKLPTGKPAFTEPLVPTLQEEKRAVMQHPEVSVIKPRPAQPAPKPITYPGFEKRALVIVDQPWLIQALRDVFLDLARAQIPRLGVDGALKYLSDQVESVHHAGVKHGDIGGARLMAQEKFAQGNIDPIIESIANQYAEQIKAAATRRDRSAIEQLVNQAIDGLQNQIEIAYNNGIIAAAEKPKATEEDLAFRRRIVDAIINAPWGQKDFSFLDLFFNLLKIAGMEILRRLGMSIEKVVAPTLGDKVQVILTRYLGRIPSQRVLDAVVMDVKNLSPVEWTQLSDAELDGYVLQALQQEGIQVPGNLGTGIPLDSDTSLGAGLISKLFGSGPLVEYADWYIGASRAQKLYDYAVETLAQYLQPLMKEVYGKPEAEKVKDEIQKKTQEIHDEIFRWQDESVGPKNDAGVPLSKTGRGAKARYEQYIATWMRQVADNIIADYKNMPKKPEIPGPGWAKQWGWFDAAIQLAINDIERVLGGAASVIDWQQVWNAIPEYDSPASLIEHYDYIDKIGPPKIVYHDVLRAVRDLFGDKLGSENLAKLIDLLPTPQGGSGGGGSAPTFSRSAW